MEIIYQKIDKNHIKDLVILHKKNAMEENFLPLLGDRAIEKFYEWWTLRDDVIAFIALFNGKVIGNVLGPTNLYYRNELNKYLFPYLFIGFIFGLFRNPIKIMKLFFKRFYFIISSIKSILFKEEKKDEIEKNEKSAILLSIDVDLEFQGKGVAVELNKMFLEEAKRRGIKKVTLSVRESNSRAIRFYEKTGWKILKKSNEARYYYFEL